MTDLWDYLKTATKPIVLYGTGDGADKILRVLDRRRIRIRGVFASDGFVRRRMFHGFPVLSYAEIKDALGEFIVLVSFASSLPDVMANIRRIDTECELYVPEVPAVGNTLFDATFAEMHKAELSRARELLSDEVSIRLFDDMIEFRLTGKLSYLVNNTCRQEAVYNDILHPQFYRLTADLGAFTGDTAKTLLQFAPRIKTLIAMEPDPSTFRRLIKNIGDNGITEAYNVGAWRGEALQSFVVGGSRSTRLAAADSGKTVQIRMQSLDRILDGRKIDFIKYDVEGAEAEAISGSAQAIVTCRPELAVSVYHRAEDLFSLPLTLAAMLPDCRFYLRRPPYIPAWDLMLYAIPEKQKKTD